jgi:hypothetical protein
MAAVVKLNNAPVEHPTMVLVPCIKTWLELGYFWDLCRSG